MKGLLLKDIYNLKSQLKVYLLFPILGMLLSFVNKDISMMTFLCCVIPVTTIMTACAYDEQSKFDSYGLTLPLERSDIVLSKYALKYLFLLVSAGIFISLSVLMVTVFGEQVFPDFNIATFLLEMLGVSFVINAVIDISLPLIFKFGTQTGRIILVVVALMVPLSGLVLGKLNMDTTFLMSIIDTHIWYIAAVTLLVIESASMFSSLQVCKHKEY